MPHVVLVLTLHYIFYVVYSATRVSSGDPTRVKSNYIQYQVRFYGKSNAVQGSSPNVLGVFVMFKNLAEIPNIAWYRRIIFLCRTRSHDVVPHNIN